MNFCKRSYQPILRYLYTETIKRGGQISLHKHFKADLIPVVSWRGGVIGEMFSCLQVQWGEGHEFLSHFLKVYI